MRAPKMRTDWKDPASRTYELTHFHCWRWIVSADSQRHARSANTRHCLEGCRRLIPGQPENQPGTNIETGQRTGALHPYGLGCDPSTLLIMAERCHRIRQNRYTHCVERNQINKPFGSQGAEKPLGTLFMLPPSAAWSMASMKRGGSWRRNCAGYG
jgi:hypothetical protein